MRTRLLTPFTSAIAGSMLVLLALIVWGRVQNESSPLALFSPSVARAEANATGVITLTTDAPTVLGDVTTLTATVEITDTEFIEPYILEWDFDGNGTTDRTTGSEDEPLNGSGNFATTYTYPGASEPGNPYSATVTLMQTRGDIAVLSDTETVAINGPDLEITAPGTAGLGERVGISVQVTNYRAAVLAGINLDFGDGQSALVTDFDVEGSTATVSATHYYTDSGTFTVMAEPSFRAYQGDQLYTSPEEAQASITVGAPAADLTVGPSPAPLVGGSATVTASVTLRGVTPDAVEAAVFSFSDGQTIEDRTAPYDAPAIFTAAGDYTVRAVVTLTEIYAGETIVATPDPANFSITEGEGGEPASISLAVGDSTLTVGNGPGAGETTIVTATVRDAENNLLSGAAVSITIESSLGAQFANGQTVYTNNTDANGVVTPTLSAGSVAGSVSLVARTGALSSTATVQQVLPTDGSVQASVTLGPTQTVTAEVGGRTFTFNIPAQPGLQGASVAIRIVPLEIGEGVVPVSNTLGIFVLAFDVQVYAVNVPGVAAGTRLDTLTGFSFNFTGFTATFEYLPGDLGAGVTSTLRLQQAEEPVLEQTLEVADYANGAFSIIPGSDVDTADNTVTSDIRQFGIHAIIGQDQVRIYMPYTAK